MLRQFGWFYHLLGLGWSLGKLRLADHDAERIREAATKGPVVYVMARRSTVDHLALNTVLNQRRLPLSMWANGVTSFWWQPVVDAWSDVYRTVRERWERGPVPDPIASGWLDRTVQAGLPVTVFIEEPPRLAERLFGQVPPDPLEALVHTQTRTDRPIQLVPITIVWERGPDQQGDLIAGFFSGIKEAPGFIGQLIRTLTQAKDAFVQVGEPLDLRELVERVEAPSRPKAVRVVLRRFLRRETTVARGPRLLPHHELKRIVLDNPPMRELARREADASGRSVQRVQRQMERDFDRIAARFRWWIVRALDVLLKPLWTRIYSGVDVRPEDMERIRAAMRNGTAILLPSHKSHFDYLLLSWVFYSNDLIVPHVIAGMNLAIWPLSIVLRGAGGFFVQRSFKGDRVFPAVFARYLRELIRRNYPIEFFIEGGRTRSGKLMPPKTGVLSMVMEAAALRRKGEEVTLLPIALAYEQVAEEAAYARELGGEKKTAESMGELVKARSVLWRRYGRVYMRVGEPIACGTVVDATADRQGWLDREKSEQREDLQRVGERIIHRIGQVNVVMPTSLVALALLAHSRRGIRHSELLARIERFRAFLTRGGALEAASLRHSSQAVHEALARFVRLKLVEGFDEGGEQVWAMAPDKRITLDFHKNQVLHSFAPAGYATLAIRALPDAPFTVDQALPGFVRLCWLLRKEFILDPDKSARQALADALVELEKHGALQRDGERWTVADPQRIGEILSLMRSVAEGYIAAYALIPQLVQRGLDPRDMPRAIQTASEGAEGARPESASLVTLQNAINALEEEGVLGTDGQGNPTFDKARCEADLHALRAMVGR